jgi:hypothetical protein
MPASGMGQLQLLVLAGNVLLAYSPGCNDPDEPFIADAGDGNRTAATAAATAGHPHSLWIALLLTAAAAAAIAAVSFLLQLRRLRLLGDQNSGHSSLCSQPRVERAWRRHSSLARFSFSNTLLLRSHLQNASRRTVERIHAQWHRLNFATKFRSQMIVTYSILNGMEMMAV